MICVDHGVLKAIRERRSVRYFLPAELDKEALDQILDAGRWAPSWINSQPWAFIVVEEPELKQAIGRIDNRKTAFSKADWMDDAAVAIVIVVDPTEHSNHFVEDGAIAAQNMALIAHGLGYASFYLGLSERKAGDTSAEEEVKQLLQVPERMRVIAILPIGIPERVPESSRKELQTLIHHNMYGHRES